MEPIPAAWYDDPAGSGGMRWWDGTAWSHHVRPAEPPPAPPQPQMYPSVQQPQPYQPVQQPYQVAPQPQPYQPLQQVQPYQPAQDHATVPPVPLYQAAQSEVQAVEPQPYQAFGGQVATQNNSWRAEPQSYTAYTAKMDNKAGWTSLVAGVIGLAIVVVTSMSGSVIVVYFFPLFVAVGSGIRSLAQRAAGTSTSLIAPILGILCAVAAGLIFFSAY